MPPSALSRRSLLRAVALGGAGLLLVGCDDGLPGQVVSPTGTVEPDDPATWPADTELLIAARQRVHGYRLGLDAVGVGASKATTELDELWRAQQERLELLITLGGVPLPDLVDDPAVTRADGDAASATGDAASRTDDAASTAGPRPEARELGRAIRTGQTAAIRDLSLATPTNLPLLASLTAQHVAAAARLGAPVDWGPLPGPTGTAAVPVLATTRPAVFGLEVLAARTRDEERERYEAVLDPLRGLTRQLATLAGDAAPVAPLGYDLPEALDSQRERRALARSLVADIAPATLDAAQRLPGALDQLPGVVRIVAETVAWQRRLGVAGAPFPGMTLP